MTPRDLLKLERQIELRFLRRRHRELSARIAELEQLLPLVPRQ